MAYITAVSATASSSQGGLPASNVIDFDETTRWGSDFSAPQNIYIDLGGVYDITAVRLRWEAANASNFDIATATTVGSWTNRLTGQAAVAGGVSGSSTDGQQILSVTATCRYVRVTGNTLPSGFGMSLWSFEADGTPAAVDDTSFSFTTKAISAVESQQVQFYSLPLTPTVGDWTQLLPLGLDGAGEQLFGQSVYFDKTDPLTLYAACIGGGAGSGDGPYSGVYKSTNGGASWLQISGTFVGSGPSQPISFTQNVAGDLIVADGVRGPTNGLHKLSATTGLWGTVGNFNSVTPSFDCYNVTSNPNDLNDILVGYHSSWGGAYTAAGALRSLDGGATWAIINPPAGLSAIGSNYVQHVHAPGNAAGAANRLLYTNETDGKYLSTNGGSSWSNVDAAPDGAMTHGGNHLIYAGGAWYCAGAYISKSVNNGTSWTRVSKTGDLAFITLATDGTSLISQQFVASKKAVAEALATPPSPSATWADFGTVTFGGGIFRLAYDPNFKRLYANVAGSGGDGVWVYQFAGAGGPVTGTTAAATAGLTAAATATYVPPRAGRRLGRFPLAGTHFTSLPGVLPTGNGTSGLRDARTRAIVADQLFAQSVTTTAAAVLGGLTASATASQAAGAGVTSTVDAQLAGLSAAATAQETIPGAVAAQFAGLTATATAQERFAATVAAAVSGLTAAATAAETIGSTVAVITAGLTASGVAAETIASTVAAQLAGLTASGSVGNVAPVTSTVAASLSGLGVSATAQERFAATVAAVVSGLTASGTAQETLPVSVAAQLAGLTATATAAESIPSTVAAALAGLSAAAVVTAGSGTFFSVNAQLAGLSAAATATESIGAAVAATLSGLTAQATATETIRSTVAANLPGLSASAASSLGVSVTVSAQLGGLAASASAAVQGLTTSSVAAVLAGLTASATAAVQEQIAASVAAQVSGLTASGSAFAQPPAVAFEVSATVGGLTVSGAIVNGRLFTTAPTQRTLSIPAEQRALSIFAEQRMLAVPADTSRVFSIR